MHVNSAAAPRIPSVVRSHRATRRRAPCSSTGASPQAASAVGLTPVRASSARTARLSRRSRRGRGGGGGGVGVGVAGSAAAAPRAIRAGQTFFEKAEGGADALEPAEQTVV